MTPFSFASKALVGVLALISEAYNVLFHCLGLLFSSLLLFSLTKFQFRKLILYGELYFVL